MLTSRAGLVEALSHQLRTNPNAFMTTMRIVAVLLLLASLLPSVAWAAPVCTQPTASATTVARCGVMAYDAPNLQPKFRSSYNELPHHLSPIVLSLSEPVLAARDEASSGIVLVRRKSFGAKIRSGFHKVVHAIKSNIGKIAKIVGVIPGAKIIGKAIDGGSQGLNAASNAIKGHFGGKLGRAMRGMDKAQKIVGYAP
ncbi:hypothetical protein D9619_011093 [Psilocybe cf. subviscida]|uniref:Uncharacterized protein n=1 Tax=Psilocybe cf. subviscida TaxID=2480587 RepID=A0A8H5BJL9_9AGAR|nr:hypothetical protein D9619_011093 [Psilocybe cf. subviscida]